MSNIRRALKHGSKLIYPAQSRQPNEILNYDVYVSSWELWNYGYLSCIRKLQLKNHNAIALSLIASSAIQQVNYSKQFRILYLNREDYKLSPIFHCLQLQDHISFYVLMPSLASAVKPVFRVTGKHTEKVNRRESTVPLHFLLKRNRMTFASMCSKFSSPKKRRPAGCDSPGAMIPNCPVSIVLLRWEHTFTLTSHRSGISTVSVSQSSQTQQSSTQFDKVGFSHFSLWWFLHDYITRQPLSPNLTCQHVSIPLTRVIFCPLYNLRWCEMSQWHIVMPRLSQGAL